ncbi:uncharacterized protein AMSG_11550, partial [Thecamonas trahens ATCC 50062]
FPALHRLDFPPPTRATADDTAPSDNLAPRVDDGRSVGRKDRALVLPILASAELSSPPSMHLPSPPALNTPTQASVAAVARAAMPEPDHGGAVGLGDSVAAGTSVSAALAAGSAMASLSASAAAAHQAHTPHHGAPPPQPARNLSVAAILSSEVVDTDALRAAVVRSAGAPHEFRPLVWRLLTGALPPPQAAWELVSGCSREAYNDLAAVVGVLLPSTYADVLDGLANSLPPLASAHAGEEEDEAVRTIALRLLRVHATAGALSPASTPRPNLLSRQSSSDGDPDAEAMLADLLFADDRDSDDEVGGSHLLAPHVVSASSPHALSLHHQIAGSLASHPQKRRLARQAVPPLPALQLQAAAAYLTAAVLDDEAEAYACFSGLMDRVLVSVVDDYPDWLDTIVSRLSGLLTSKSARLAAHFDELELDLHRPVSAWLASLFLGTLASDSVERLLDCTLALGPDLFVFMSYALLYSYTPKLLGFKSAAAVEAFLLALPADVDVSAAIRMACTMTADSDEPHA